MSPLLSFWLLLASALALSEAFSRRWLIAPFGLGAVVAASLEVVHVVVDWQWVAFVGVSSLAFVAIHRFSDIPQRFGRR